MKKVIAAILALSLVFALSLTSFADYLPGEEQHLTTILNTVNTPPKAPATLCEKLIESLQNNGYDKPVIKYCLDKLKANGSLKNDGRYENLIAALEAAPDTAKPTIIMKPGTPPTTATTTPATTAPTTSPSGGSGTGTTSGSGSLLPDLTLPNLPDITLPDINFDELVSAEELIQKLKDAGIPASAMQTVVDALHSAGAIDDDMYNEATNLINANEPTSESSNEGGIGGFLSGIVDTISGLFGGGTGDAGTGSGSSDEFGGSQATGDTALISVVAVAAVAGAALLLTKKKKEDK